ncbi:TetR/AcrR family transcriptional regulator [Streptantibioticus parmotrematis]|uniref:TetR/AcrR family transcriptional regulator n=1 Tax=Streptantibioticus parmotrematis TaxID=2873249 RepID=UPI0033F9F143
MGTRHKTAHAGVTREDLADAALRLLERDGTKGLSMRKVAAEVGVQAASLYWHVRDKEELLDLACDALWADFDAPPPHTTDPAGPHSPGGTDDWRPQVAVLARRLRAHLLSRSNAARVLVGRFAPGPRWLDRMESLIATLRTAGFDGRDAADATYLLGTWVQGFVLHESVPMSAAEQRGASPAEATALARRELEELPVERYPNVVALAGDIAGPDMDTRFEFGLARLLDGLEPLRATATPKQAE